MPFFETFAQILTLENVSKITSYRINATDEDLLCLLRRLNTSEAVLITISSPLGSCVANVVMEETFWEQATTTTGNLYEDSVVQVVKL